MLLLLLLAAGNAYNAGGMAHLLMLLLQLF